jgi:hypothetical protein
MMLGDALASIDHSLLSYHKSRRPATARRPDFEMPLSGLSPAAFRVQSN